MRNGFGWPCGLRLPLLLSSAGECSVEIFFNGIQIAWLFNGSYSLGVLCWLQCALCIILFLLALARITSFMSWVAFAGSYANSTVTSFA